MLWPCLCSLRVPYTEAFMSSHYIGGGWCHALSCLSAALLSVWPREVSALCIMAWEMSTKNKKRGAFELATVPLCLGPPLKTHQCCNKNSGGKTHWWNNILPSQQSCHFQIRVTSLLKCSTLIISTLSVQSLHPCSQMFHFWKETWAPPHRHKKIRLWGVASALKIPKEGHEVSKVCFSMQSYLF